MTNPPIDAVTDGSLHWAVVDLLDIEDNTARTTRDALEEFGLRVDYLPVGQARHIVAALGSARPVADYVLLSCHGDEGRILLRELGGPVADRQPFTGALGPAEVRAHLRFPGSVVISNGCETGTAELADAFLAAGARAYLAPADAPDGHDAFLAVLLLFHALAGGADLPAAVERMRGHHTEFAMWRLWL